MPSGVLKRVDNIKSGRGRPKLPWNELVKIDLREWNISKDLAMDKGALRLASMCMYHDLLCASLFLVSLHVISSLPKIA